MDLELEGLQYGFRVIHSTLTLWRINTDQVFNFPKSLPTSQWQNLSEYDLIPQLKETFNL